MVLSYYYLLKKELLVQEAYIWGDTCGEDLKGVIRPPFSRANTVKCVFLVLGVYINFSADRPQQNLLTDCLFLLLYEELVGDSELTLHASRFTIRGNSYFDFLYLRNDLGCWFFSFFHDHFRRPDWVLTLMA